MDRASGKLLLLWRKFELEGSNPLWLVVIEQFRNLQLRQKAITDAGGPDLLSVGPLTPMMQDYSGAMVMISDAFMAVQRDEYGIRLSADGNDFDIVKPSGSEMSGVIPALILAGVVIVSGAWTYLSAQETKRKGIEKEIVKKKQEIASWIASKPELAPAIKGSAEWISADQSDSNIKQIIEAAAPSFSGLTTFIGLVVVLWVLGPILGGSR